MLNLREHHLQRDKKKGRSSIEVGDVVVVKSDVSNRAFWRLGLVEELVLGSDGQVRAAVVKMGDKSSSGRTVLLRRSIKHVFPLEEKGNSPLLMRTEPVSLKLANDKVHSDLGDSPPKLSTKTDADDLSGPESNIEPVADDGTSGRRPHRQAAIAGEKLHRKKM